jgi:hypothetical protein
MACTNSASSTVKAVPDIFNGARHLPTSLALFRIRDNQALPENFSNGSEAPLPPDLDPR